MLLKGRTLERIVSGDVTLQFRRWKRPTVRAGGTLLTFRGQLAIDAVDLVEEQDITEGEAVAAGYASRAELVEALAPRRDETRVYRVALRFAGPDPREALRNRIPEDGELSEVVRKLDGWDARAASGPWTRRVLAAIRDRPEERAADLAVVVGMEKEPFKAKVRKLKGLGLTESLEAGYRLSPRGERVLDELG